MQQELTGSPRHKESEKKSFSIIELNHIKIRVIKLIYSTFLLLSSAALAVYLYGIVFIFDRFLQSIVFFLITLLFFSVSLYYRIKTDHHNLRTATNLIIATLVIIGLFASLLAGTSSFTTSLLLVASIIVSVIVYGAKASNMIFFTIIFSLIGIATLHNLQVIPIDSPGTTNSDAPQTLIVLTFFWVIFQISLIGYGQIQTAFAKAIEYSDELETLNQELDQKVKDRTAELEKNYDMQIESMYTMSVLGNITRPLLHDITTPISALSGTLNLLMKSQPDDEELLAIAKNSSDQISQIIEETQLFMKGRNVTEEFDAIELTQKAVEILTSEIQRLEIDVVTTNKLDTSQAKLLGSPGFFIRIVTNLLVNAVEELKNVTERKRKILIQFESIKKGSKDFLAICITDNGRGILESDLEKIFQLDYSSKQSSKHNQGIGLPFVKQTIEKKFKGQIDVQSQINKNTQIMLYFPTEKNYLEDENNKKNN